MVHHGAPGPEGLYEPAHVPVELLLCLDRPSGTGPLPALQEGVHKTRLQFDTALADILIRIVVGNQASPVKAAVFRQGPHGIQHPLP